jgi:hypothetical protein
MIQTTVKKLRAELSVCAISAWAESAPDVLLWTLTMGALAAQGSSEAGFFRRACAVAFADTGAGLAAQGGPGKDGKEDVVTALLRRMKGVLWIDMLFDAEAGALWARIAGGAGKEGDGEGEGAATTPEIEVDDVVGMLTGSRFFSEPSASGRC